VQRDRPQARNPGTDVVFARKLRGEGLVLVDSQVDHEKLPPEWPRWSRVDDPEPAWLERAIEYYKGFLSFREVAACISLEEKLIVTKSQLRRLLADKVRARRPAGAPFHYWIHRNLDGPSEKGIADLKARLEDEGHSPESIKDEVEAHKRLEAPVTAFIYSDQSPWRDERLIKRLMANANGAHATTGGRIGGLAFETFLVNSLRQAGYDARLFPPGNAGADAEFETRSDSLVVRLSLKSQGREGEQSGGRVDISSLTPHDEGLPTDVRKTRKVLNVARLI
jgi:hypothetical protein